MHDLNLASIYCDRIYLLDRGKVSANGTPKEVLTKNLIESIYGIEVEIEHNRQTGHLSIIFLGSNQRKPVIW